MNNPVDRLLNHITMYRLVLYYVGGLAAVAFVGGLARLTTTNATDLAFSTVVVVGTCWLANKAFTLIYRVPVNTESVHITALIIILLMPPVAASDTAGVIGLVVASVAAIVSKFLIAVGRKHIFNPVAVGVVASGYLVAQPATWWVDGNMLMILCVLAGGLLVVRKVQRFDMVGAYILANLAVVLLTSPPGMLTETLKFSVVYSPLLFAGFAMLTEPLTSPHARWSRIAYGVIVGALSSPSVHIGGFYLSPELALLIGNAFAFAVSPKGRFKLTLRRIEKVAAGSYDFVFEPDRRLRFRPGQYLDWTLPVRHPDDRGNRRPFTIASAPTEDEVRLGVKFYRNPSAYKRALARMKPGDVIYGSQLAGSFTLPSSREEKLAFIAGGIGVTPFRSMVQDMIDRNERRSIVFIYGNNRVDEIAYADVFERARREIGLRTIYTVADGDERVVPEHRGFIDEDLIRREVPDFQERTFYISGPHAMVTRFRRSLRDLGVSRSRIKVDYFPGFA